MKKEVFQNMKRNTGLLAGLEKKRGGTMSKSICFTISKYAYASLGKMAGVARSLSIPSVNIVPYDDFSNEVGIECDKELKENFTGQICHLHER